jgi:hypothetical protein
MCQHTKHQDSDLYNLQKLHATCTTVNTSPNPHTGVTQSARLAMTAYNYIIIYIFTQSAPPTNYKEPAKSGPLRIQQ